MDVTSRFYAFQGGRHVSAVSRQPDSAYAASQAILAKLVDGTSTPSTSSVLDVQEEIEQLETSLSSGGVSDEDKAHRSAIVAILYESLRSLVAQAQARDLGKLQRELVIKKHFQPDVARIPTRVVNPASFSPSGGEESAEPALEHEAELLLATYQTDTDQVVEVRRKIQETSALLSVLSTRAVEQDELAGGILATASESIGFVASAEEQLKKAIKHNSSYRLYLVTWFMTLACILWFLHFVK